MYSKIHIDFKYRVEKSRSRRVDVEQGRAEQSGAISVNPARVGFQGQFHPRILRVPLYHTSVIYLLSTIYHLPLLYALCSREYSNTYHLLLVPYGQSYVIRLQRGTDIATLKKTVFLDCSG